MVDLGKSPLCESFLPADRLEAMEPFYPAPRPRLHAVLARAAPVVRCAGRDLPRVRLLLGVLGLVGRALARVRRHDQRPPRAHARQPRRRARLERRLPAAALPAEGHPGARDRPGCERRARRRGAGRSDARRVLRRRARRAAGRRGPPADLVLGNNVLAQVPDLNDFVGGVAILLAPGGTATFEFPHLHAARRAPVRHDLPRAFLVLLADDDRRGSSQRTGLRVVDVEELPSHGGSLRVYAAHAADGREASPAGCGAHRRGRTRRACAIRSRYGGSPRRSRNRSGPCSTS